MALDQGSSSAFDNLSNFRDVATVVNKAQPSKQLRPGQLFRSARPDEASTRDHTLLREIYQINTIVDLRTTTELINAAKKYEGQRDAARSAAIPKPNQALSEPLRVPGIGYAGINLNGKGFERSLLWHLSYYSLARVVGYMLWGYRMEAIEIIGREVLQPRGLVGLAIDTLEHSQPEIRTFFELLSQADVWPVMIHCTQGKDRTGITVILVLLLCGIDIDTITYDYVLSEPNSDAVLKDRLKDTNSIGLDESFARCPQELPLAVKQHIDEKYGSIDQYLHRVGLSELQLQKVRAALLQSDADPTAQSWN